MSTSSIIYIIAAVGILGAVILQFWIVAFIFGLIAIVASSIGREQAKEKNNKDDDDDLDDLGDELEYLDDDVNENDDDIIW